MAELSDKLRALMQTHGVQRGSEWRQEAEDLARRRAAGEFEIDKVVPGEVIGDEDGAFYRVRETFPLDYRQGSIALGEALNANPEHLALAACDEDLADFDPTTAIFIDTETIGLAGGAGTPAFLIGVGRFMRNSFVLDQCFMRDYDDEEAMVAYLKEEFAECGTIVTYNGKTFDVPLLRSRFITNRVPFPLDAAAHLDLVHVARRFWRLRLQDCSLSNIERSVLGLTRVGDVPSWEIPQIWLDYLRTRDARRLEAVFYHHKMDILSLAALTAHISSHIDPAGARDHDEDELSLVRLHFRQKRFHEVISRVESVLAQERADDVRRGCMEMMAFAYKRLKEWEAMRDAFERLLADDPRDVYCRLELAKCYEHRTKDLDAARRICAETLELIDTRQALDRMGAGEEYHAAEFQRRLIRIERKLSRSR